MHRSIAKNSRCRQFLPNTALLGRSEYLGAVCIRKSVVSPYASSIALMFLCFISIDESVRLLSMGDSARRSDDLLYEGAVPLPQQSMRT